MRNAPFDGILNVDKPLGITSMDVVRRIKRASGIKGVGHGGTLDPAATGVVPICIGQATRIMEYLVDGTKDYRAIVEFGKATDTYDAVGQVTREEDPSGLTQARVEEALEGFRGVTHQVPPMFSALKRKGKRLYELARSGIEVDREPRRVEVHDLRLTEWSPPKATLSVRCGRGFYIRSLAHDLGQTLGCGGHLKGLVRERSGPFRIEDALSLTEAEERFLEDNWQEVTYAPDVVLSDLRAVIVGARLKEDIAHGRPLPAGLGIPHSRPDERCRAYSADGRFLAVLRFHASPVQWRAEKVFSLAYPEGKESRENHP